MYSWLRGNFRNVRIVTDPSGASRVLSVVDPAEELRFLTEAAALVPNYDHAAIDVRGADAADYLHRRLTCNVFRIPPGGAAPGLQLEGDGRLQFPLLLGRLPEGRGEAESEPAPPTNPDEDAPPPRPTLGTPQGGSFLALVPIEVAELAYETTARYVLMDEVTIERAWERFGCVSLVGPAAAAVLARASDPASPGGGAAAGEAASDPDGSRVVRFRIEGTPCVAIRDPRWPIPFFHVLADFEGLGGVVRALEEACSEEGGGPAGAVAFEFARIRAGVPRFGFDLRAGRIPLESHAVSSIDFDKGCFPGQEFLARIRNLGHPPRLLARFAWEAGPGDAAEGRVPEPGARIRVGDDDRAGEIASAAVLDAEGVALGFLEWKHREASEATLGLVAPPETDSDVSPAPAGSDAEEAAPGIAAGVVEVPGADFYAGERPRL